MRWRGYTKDNVPWLRQIGHNNWFRDSQVAQHHCSQGILEAIALELSHDFCLDMACGDLSYGCFSKFGVPQTILLGVSIGFPMYNGWMMFLGAPQGKPQGHGTSAGDGRVHRINPRVWMPGEHQSAVPKLCPTHPTCWEACSVGPQCAETKKRGILV